MTDTTPKETSMTDRIDHAAAARRHIEWAWREDEGATDATTIALLAQVHATLALVEQQRIANRIALSSLTYEIEDAHNAIGQRALHQLPDIAAALGIKAVDDE